jgi:hypothetical protein
MQKVLVRLAVSTFCVLALVLPGFAGQLDDFYLAAFAPKLPVTAMEKALLTPAAGPARAVRSGTPLKHGLSRDWNKLQPATRTVLAKQLALPVLPNAIVSSGGHFTIHYATGSDANAPNLALINTYTGLGLVNTSQWATQVGDAFEAAYAFYLARGYHLPPIVPYHIYLANLVPLGEYGETDDQGSLASSDFPFASGSYIQIDKDFTNNIFSPQLYNPLQSLQVTSVHEFHHAVQYGYNFYFDVWYAEATSTWYESELYPTINQNYDYIPGWFSNSIRQIDLPQADSGFNSQAYGRWIFNRYLAEQHSVTAIRDFWARIPSIASINGQDIPMAPVINAELAASYNSSFGAELFGFAKRVYTRDWSTTGTVTPAQILLIPPMTRDSANNFSRYPVSPATVTLPHYSFTSYKFTPSASTATLVISLAKTGGIQTAVFRNQGGIVSEVAADVGGASYTLSGFDAMDPQNDEVVLLLVNTSDVDSQQASFSSNGSLASLREPTGGSVYNPVAASASTVAASGNKGGCFIATAAYGSYLHPKVALLRAFRDDYLLTNAPGRLFVALYYRVSPPLADLIARHSTLKGATRLLLAPLVLAVEHGRVALLLLLAAVLLAARVGIRRWSAAPKSDTVSEV